MTEPPRSPDNSCQIFMERPEWYRHAREAEQRWGVPIPVQLSIIYQESTFRPRARPPRGRILGVIPGSRPSSAYGYGQVIDATWRAYQRGPGGAGASRDDFGDVVHFIGWYGQSLQADAGIALEDPRQFYLAYHEGPAGFKRAAYRGKPLIEQAAANVAARARRYESQLGGCRADLDAQLQGGSWWPF